MERRQQSLGTQKYYLLCDFELLHLVRIQLILLSEEAQNHIVNNTFEYPMIKGVSPHPLVVNMGLDFKQDLKTKVVNYGKRQADALEVMTAAGWK